MTTLHTPATVPAAPSWRRTVAAYIALTKPRIIELLLVTTVPTMFLAQRGVPPLWLVAATLIGGILSAGSANTYNMVYDRDIDAHMGRTSGRPLVTGAVSPRAALIFATVLAIASTLWFALVVNVLSAALSLAAIILYAVGYTGGAAGAFPPMVGWAAVTGTIAWAPVVLFLVIFLWTPPHYWPLSMRFKQDYAHAGVPMLPVLQSNVTVGRAIVRYAWAMVAATLVLIPVAPMGWLYAVAAVLSGGLFLVEAHRLLRAARADASMAQLNPMRLFHYSITYVTVVFLAVAVDPLLYLPIG